MKNKKRIIVFLIYITLVIFANQFLAQNCAEPNVICCFEPGCPTNWFCESYLWYFSGCIIHCYDNILYHRILCIEFP